LIGSSLAAQHEDDDFFASATDLHREAEACPGKQAPFTLIQGFDFW